MLYIQYILFDITFMFKCSKCESWISNYYSVCNYDYMMHGACLYMTQMH